MEFVIIERLYEDVEIPTRATYGSAGYDLKAYFSGQSITMYDNNNNPYNAEPTKDFPLMIPPGSTALIPTGFKVRLQSNQEAQIRPRSGLALKQKLVPVNSPGTIDSDFPHEWAVLLYNMADVPAVIKHGDRIAQAVISIYQAVRFEEGRVDYS